MFTLIVHCTHAPSIYERYYGYKRHESQDLSKWHSIVFASSSSDKMRDDR